MPPITSQEPKPTGSDDTEEMLRQMRNRFDQAEQAETENRELAIEDIQFRNGDQWPANVKTERDQTNRPMFVINKVEQVCDLITGMARQQTPSIKVRPVLLGSEQKQDLQMENVASSKNYKRAEVYQGLIHDIQNNSMASAVYKYALDQAAGSGFGYIRVHTDYVSDDVFEQEIKIKRIRNQFTVYMDPNAEDPIKSDAKWFFIAQWLGADEYKDLYGAHDTFEQGQLGEGFEKWYRPDTVRVAEYYWCEQKRDTLYLLADGTVVGQEDYDKLDRKPEVLKKRAVVRPRWQWAVVTGRRILDGPYEWPSRFPCVVPVYGKELNIEGKTMYRGAIRHAKDPQRLYNFWRTTTTETVALAPKSPYIVDMKNMADYQHIWKTANTKNHAFLPYDSSRGGNKPERADPPAVPQAAIAETQQADADIQATTGFYNPSLGRDERGADKSGRAIIAEQQQGQVSTSHYHDNLALSVAQVGRVIVDLIPRIYDTERVIRMGFIDDTEDFVRINQEIQTDEGTAVINDLTAGRYDIVIDITPEFKTARLEAVQGMRELVAAAPMIAPVLLPTIAKNLDWPGADEIEETIKKYLPQIFGPAPGAPGAPVAAPGGNGQALSGLVPPQ